MEKIKPILSGGICLTLAGLLLLFPLQWILAAVMAAAFHELCHWAAIVLCAKQSVPVRFFTFGAQMQLPPMSRFQEALCALAGPVGGVFLLLFARWFPRTAVCGAFQSFYNLIPVYPMDGGRALQSLLSMLLSPPAVAKFCDIAEMLSLAGLLLLGLYAWLALSLGIMPLCLAVWTLLRIKFSKMPCKVEQLRVQ